MMQTDLMSCLRGNARHLVDPALDDRPGVVRTGACLRVELHRARAEVREVEALDRAVVERDVGHRRRIARVDAEAVVLRRHEDATRRALEDGMVRSSMTEAELRRR